MSLQPAGSPCRVRIPHIRPEGLSLAGSELRQEYRDGGS